ncbi:MAG: hypothetical protein ACJ762_10945 [Solirubrobacteraceae bacterium]
MPTAGSLPAAVLAVLSGALIAAGGAQADGVVPGQGQQLRVGSGVKGVCSPQSPARPTDLSVEQDGQAYHGTYVYSSFLYAVRGRDAGDPVSAQAWDPGIASSYRVPPTDGHTPDACSFRGGNDAGGNPTRLQAAPLLRRGTYVMRVITVTYDETYDNSAGWVPKSDDESETTQDVVFSAVTTNPCDSEWVGMTASAALCLKEKQKKDAAAASKEHAEDLKDAKRSYAALGCGSSGLSAGSDFRWKDSRETHLACAAESARRIYDEAMSTTEAALAADPPVKDFTTLARPATVDLPIPGKGQHALAAVRRLLLAEAAIPGLLDALVLDINRANGAFVAGDEAWVDKQNAAGRAAAAKARRLLRSLPGLQRAAARSAPGRLAVALRAQRTVPKAAAAVSDLPATD